MIKASELPDKLCQWFSDMSGFSDCVFTTQFPAETKDAPIIKPVVAIGVQSVSIADYESEDSSTVVSDYRYADQVFCVNIHVPRTMGGSVCYEIFDRLYDLLLFDSEIVPVEVNSSEISYIRTTDSLCMKTEFSIREIFTMSENDYPEPFTME
ncbi:MAG: hypothetical protein LUG85_00955 [Clostridiales bacterium]|nr:hypothetical protein [Clostridiales bacterium]MCD7827095.1 hypothetical protein [Clostridiales bacterium]